jgi:hypothetical protein
MSFLMNSWRDGTPGAIRMGLEHGAYCLGCCWLLFLILFPLGMMNIAILALITILIFAEKVLPMGRQIARAAGLGLIVYGTVVVFVPSALPMTMNTDDHASMAEMSGTGDMDGATDDMSGMEADEMPAGMDSQGMSDGDEMGQMESME